jgi:alkanesulfonate monooxygenase SsuD/methylene tetrahydromethanopterin reductase-like flavin-dependent oxidoreductase (luciferase family)
VGAQPRAGAPAKKMRAICREVIEKDSNKRRLLSEDTKLQSVTLSVLDTGRPEESVELARRIEAAGYDRLWVTEHHTETQSACPAVVAAAVLASTSRLSVTVGGVLARIHSPLFIAEQLKLLAKLFGQRVQFGVAGTLPDVSVRDAAQTPLAQSAEEYSERLLRVCDLAIPRGTQPAEEHSGGLVVGPVGSEPASFTICGTSEGAAAFAGRLGFPFAFHDFLSPQQDRRERISVCRRYFEAGGNRLAVAVSGISAETHDEAERLWLEGFRDRGLRRPSFLGTPGQCAAQIGSIVEEMSADEVVIQPLLYDFEQRIGILESLIEPLNPERRSDD